MLSWPGPRLPMFATSLVTRNWPPTTDTVPVPPVAGLPSEEKPTCKKDESATVPLDNVSKPWLWSAPIKSVDALTVPDFTVSVPVLVDKRPMRTPFAAVVSNVPPSTVTAPPLLLKSEPDKTCTVELDAMNAPPVLIVTAETLRKELDAVNAPPLGMVSVLG